MEKRTINVNINSLVKELTIVTTDTENLEFEKELANALNTIVENCSKIDNKGNIDLLSEMAAKATDPEEKFMIAKTLCDLMKYRGYKKREIVSSLQNVGLSGFTSINLYIQSRYKSRVETLEQKQSLHLNNSDVK